MLAESTTEKIAGSSAHFVICNACFWCASLLDGIGTLIDVCPSCSEKAMESLPLSRNERYTFSYNTVAGVVLEFSIDGKRKAAGIQMA